MGKLENDTKPKNWPTNIEYLSRPSYSTHLTQSQRQALKTRTSCSDVIPANLPKGPCPLVRITLITSPGHPACGQCGLFATKNLPPGSLILPYYGVVYSASPPHTAAHESSDYDLWLEREAGVSVDAERTGNEARFVNDYRGVRHRPNAEFRECWDSRSGEKTMAVFVLPAGKKSLGKKGVAGGAGDGIAKGEEICVSYGKGFWGKRAEEEGTEGENG